jgi:hypothetical protein
MATLPQIAKSESVENKQKHITKHSNSIPMLKMFIAQGILNVSTLDEAACDQVLATNGMLALDEVSKEDVIMDKVASKVDAVMRIPNELKDIFGNSGYQSTEGLMKVNFSTVIYVHRNHDTDALIQDLTDMVNGKATITS